jgi:hypothetical protein
MKNCTKCKIDKNESEFSKDKGSRDGLHAHCRQCRQQYRLNNSGKNIQYNIQYRLEHTDDLLKYKKRYNKKYKISNPVKHKAHKAVTIAIALGKLPAAKDCICKYCPSQAVEYHHYSYDIKNWLDVIPLCVCCHRLLHTYIKAYSLRRYNSELLINVIVSGKLIIEKINRNFNKVINWRSNNV